MVLDLHGAGGGPAPPSKQEVATGVQGEVVLLVPSDPRPLEGHRGNAVGVGRLGLLNVLAVINGRLGSLHDVPVHMHMHMYAFMVLELYHVGAWVQAK